MKINCPYCGQKVSLNEVYDNYQGGIRCVFCSALVEIKSDRGHLTSIKFVNVSPRTSPRKVFDRSRQAADSSAETVNAE